ncbi:MAG: OmpA family protein, partial [Candidatus Deferrimicrobiaceae bacterium]
MKGSMGGKWILSALSVVLLTFAVGCAKKELVKSTDTASGAAVSTLPPAETQVGKQEPIVTEPTQTAMAGRAATQEKPSDFPDIHFDFDKSFLREDAKPILQEVAAYLKANQAASILIEGHCDERGT